MTGATNGSHAARAVDSSLSRSSPACTDAKVLATLQARAALAGWELKASTDEAGRACYSVTRWGRVQVLADLAQVSTFLQRVGAPC